MSAKLWRPWEEGGRWTIIMHRKFNQLETRCGRESQHPAEGAFRLPINELGIRPVGEKMLDWGTCSWKAGPPGPCWASQENGKETRLWPIEWGSICCSSVRSPTPSHTQPFQKKWEVYFSKNCVARFYCVVVMFMHAYEYATTGDRTSDHRNRA